MENESKYLPGSLLWCKVGNYPFWPCMVSYDPSSGCYCREKKVRECMQLIYHVQFFGKAVEHGWTSPGRIFLFDGTGYAGFLEKKAALVKEAAGKCAKKKILFMFNLPEGQRKLSWEIAIQEAMMAYEIPDLEERFKTHVFIYEKIDNKKAKPMSESVVATQQKETDELRAEKVKKKSAIEYSEDSDEPPLKRSKQNESVIEKFKKKKLLSDEDFNDVCKICEKSMVEFSCSGQCLQSYHTDCLGLLSIPSDFKCNGCAMGNISCFACKKSDGIIKKCKHSKCQKSYHDECLDRYCYTRIRGSSSEKICGFHSCLTCYKENAENIMSFKGPFLRCFRCPTAFHDRESCIAAGSVYLSQTTILCPDHFIGKHKSTALVNTSKCLMCEEGGELICCETCPQAYHAQCLDTPVPNGDFFCEDCVSRKPFSYGMIVLGKTGNYRFWPAMIIAPKDIPENVKNFPHNDGEFVIKYFGTCDYTWTHKGRLLPYLEDLRGSIKLSQKTKLDFHYKKSFEEAFIAFKKYQDGRYSLNDKPEAYKHIRVNKAIPPAVIYNAVPEEGACYCKAEENPCSTSECLNRSTRTECVPETCSAVSVCRNQRFQRKQYPKLKIIRTSGRGWGLSAQEPIKKGEFIIEYVGEIITNEEYQRRCVDLRNRNKNNFYFLYLDARRMIDAGPSGNLSRFINHSCEPNCELQKWNVAGDSRVGIFALVDIPPGEELSFNYDSETFEFKDICCCGTPTCQRYRFTQSKPENKRRKSKGIMKDKTSNQKQKPADKVAKTAELEGRKSVPLEPVKDKLPASLTSDAEAQGSPESSVIGDEAESPGVLPGLPSLRVSLL